MHGGVLQCAANEKMSSANLGEVRVRLHIFHCPVSDFMMYWTNELHKSVLGGAGLTAWFLARDGSVCSLRHSALMLVVGRITL